MKGSIFAVLLVLYLSVYGAFAHITKCKTQKGAAITRGKVIKKWNWMSSDPANEKTTWRECKSRCQLYGGCKGWNYQYVECIIWFLCSVSVLGRRTKPSSHCRGSLRLVAEPPTRAVVAASTPRLRSTRRTTSAGALPTQENASSLARQTFAAVVIPADTLKIPNKTRTRKVDQKKDVSSNASWLDLVVEPCNLAQSTIASPPAYALS